MPNQRKIQRANDSSKQKTGKQSKARKNAGDQVVRVVVLSSDCLGS